MKPAMLHVEDDPNDALLVNLAFRKLNLTTQLHSVDDGEKAMAYLSGTAPYELRDEHPFPGFMLLDLKLHRSSGFDVLAWTRNQPLLRYLPVVVLSSSTREEDIRRAYDLGANSYVTKPSSLERLVEMVRTAHDYWMGFNRFSITPATVASQFRGLPHEL
jgi:CheY-like chemotaxis protein